MAEVVSFAKAKEERSPHWAGPCVCLGCGHEWTGVGPIGECVVSCPSCGLKKGHTKYLFSGDDGDMQFRCNCGSEALVAFLRKGKFRIICMSCGTNQTEAIYG